jgi:hypothetical protein
VLQLAVIIFGACTYVVHDRENIWRGRGAKGMVAGGKYGDMISGR